MQMRDSTMLEQELHTEEAVCISTSITTSLATALCYPAFAFCLTNV